MQGDSLGLPMKTNHRRGYKAETHPKKGGTRFQKKGVLSDAAPVAMSDFESSNGNRGMAKQVRGAKKFVNSRFRFHENAATKKLADEAE